MPPFRMMWFSAICLMILPALGSEPKPSEKIDNPDYQAWSKFKVGTWLKSKRIHTSNGLSFEVESKSTLVRLDTDRAVLEIEERDNSGGSWKESLRNLHEVPAKMTLEELRKSRFGVTREGKLQEGEDEIEVAGKKLKCHWKAYESGSKDHGERYKVWFHDAIPGGVAQWELENWDTRPPCHGKMRFDVVGW